MCLFQTDLEEAANQLGADLKVLKVWKRSVEPHIKTHFGSKRGVGINYVSDCGWNEYEIEAFWSEYSEWIKG